nr:unnamed protein product [Callosobruchus chinensis]
MNYDKHTRRSTLVYKKGDKVVIKCKNEKVWTKAIIIIEKANEPRSYWVKKEGSNKIIRRNTSQIKPSVTGSDRQVINESELYPGETFITNTQFKARSLPPHISNSIGSTSSYCSIHPAPVTQSYSNVENNSNSQHVR